MSDDIRRRCACQHGMVHHHPLPPFACTFPGCSCGGYCAAERRVRQRERRTIPRGGRRLEDVIAADDGAPFTPPEAARISTLSESQIRREMDAGELKSIHFGLGRKKRRRLIPWPEFKAYLQRMGLLHKSDAA